MSRIVVLGEPPVVDVWVLAGALVVTAAGDESVRRAWDALPADVEVVVTTPVAAGALGERARERLVVVLP